MKPKARSFLTFLLKIAFVGAVFYWLAQKDLISFTAFRRGWDRKDLLTWGFLALIAASLLSAVRWQLLLRSQDLIVPHSRVLQLHLIGNFFNVALPGAVSGDFVKAFYIAREIQGMRGQTFGTILFDRVVGLTALVLVSVGALLTDLERFRSSMVLRGVQTFVLLAGIGVVIFYGYLFLVREHHDPVLRILKLLERKHERFSSLVRIYLGIRHYHSRKIVVLTVLAMSIAIQLLAGFAVYQFALAMGETFLRMNQVYAVAPLGFLVTAIPVLPGGVGTGHAAFSFFFQLLGSKLGADVFSFYVIGQLAIGAVGGLIYLRFRSSFLPVQSSQFIDSQNHPKGITDELETVSETGPIDPSKR